MVSEANKVGHVSLNIKNSRMVSMYSSICCYEKGQFWEESGTINLHHGVLFRGWANSNPPSHPSPSLLPETDWSLGTNLDQRLANLVVSIASSPGFLVFSAYTWEEGQSGTQNQVSDATNTRGYPQLWKFWVVWCRYFLASLSWCKNYATASLVNQKSLLFHQVTQGSTCDDSFMWFCVPSSASFMALVEKIGEPGNKIRYSVSIEITCSVFSSLPSCCADDFVIIILLFQCAVVNDVMHGWMHPN